MKNVVQIVITGGPCAGKTKALCKIEQDLTQKGYKVIIVPEAATMVINGGIGPGNMTMLDFQRTIYEMQTSHEDVFLRAIQRLNDENIVIIYDRGVIDNKAYMTEGDFNIILSEYGEKELHLKEKYNAVIHMVTAADGATQYYTLSNNTARTESPELAIERDRKTLNAWIGHSHLRKIDNSTNFERKLDRLMAEIYNILGLPVPIEIERKYLVKMPDIEAISLVTAVSKTEIIQTYLKSIEDQERRIRQRGLEGDYVYYYTTKQKIDDLKRIETERKISADEYVDLMMEADTSLKQIKKTRYCFMWENQYFELDIYPFWLDKAIIEVELTEENQEVKIPNFISVIKEVTEDDRYKNYGIARGNLPEE